FRMACEKDFRRTPIAISPGCGHLLDEPAGKSLGVLLFRRCRELLGVRRVNELIFREPSCHGTSDFWGSSDRRANNGRVGESVGGGRRVGYSELRSLATNGS